jgi:pimeloyl-ACP methyl ester carboxylesterase
LEIMHRFFTYSPFRHYFEYKWYNLELLRLLGSAPYGGCDAAEFLETVGSLIPNDANSWREQWLSRAERTQALAEEIEESGHLSAARGAYLRASNYFRCAQYMFPNHLPSDQPYFLALYLRSVSSFEQAMRLVPHDVHKVEIPYQHSHDVAIKLPGWFHIPAQFQRLLGRKTPVLICFGGADSTQEELYFLSVAEGPALGYAVLTFDGPGQGLVLRRDKVHLRPDGEVVLGAVLDWLKTFSEDHPEANLDLKALSVTGQSLGAYLALRGAADPRIKACIAVDPIYDLWDLAMSRMPGWMVWPWERDYMGDGLIDWAVVTHGKYDVATKYMFAQAQDMLGSPNSGQTLRDMKPYTFRLHRTVTEPQENHIIGDYLERIKIPVLITGAAADPKTFLPELSTDAIIRNLINVEEGDKELWVPEAYSEGGAQAKSGAWQLLQYRTFKFLDKKFGIVREPPQNEIASIHKGNGVLQNGVLHNGTLQNGILQNGNGFHTK